MIDTTFIMTLGAVFAVLFLLQAWVTNVWRKKQLKAMEKRMTDHMIKAIEKLEWRDD